MFERPLLLLLLAGAPIAAAPGLAAFRRGRHASGVTEATVRVLAYVALVIVVAGLQIPARVGARRIAVVVGIDESRSIAPDQLRWMRAEAVRLARVMDPKDRIAIIGFGRDARVLFPLGDPRTLTGLDAPVDGGATDLANMLTTSLGLFPADSEKRVVLLSDGNQTTGDALATVPELNEAGVRVYAGAPPPPAQRRVAIVAVHAPDAVRPGARFAVGVDVESEATQDVAAQLALSAGDAAASEQRNVTLHPGLNHFTLSRQIDKPGTHALDATLSVLGPLEMINPHASAAVAVLGAPRVLIASATPLKSLVKALAARHYRIEQTAVQAMPTDAESYLPYQAVILGEANAAILNPGVQAALARYVTDFGGGLVATGATMMDERLRGGALERVLPARFVRQPPRKRAPAAIYLCIDRSNSMNFNSRDPDLRDGERIHYVKRAATALIEQLQDTDLAGVIAFDSEPYVLAHLQPLAKDRGQLLDRIERLEPGGGTDFKEALEIAEQEILAAALPTRQVILLTDGDTAREYQDHNALIASYAREHIPLSTIRIGPDATNVRLLQNFAQATGGTFYRVTDITSLPQLLVRLTQRTTDHGDLDHLITYGDPSVILTGIPRDQVPAIDYTAVVEPRPDAQVPIIIHKQDDDEPLLATWQYGLGRTAVFAADPDAVTTLAWIQWDRYAQFWSQLIGWVMPAGSGGALQVRVETGPAGTRIEAENFGAPRAAGLYCQVAGKSTMLTVAMSRAAGALYRADLGSLAAGEYTLTVSDGPGSETRVLARRPFLVLPARADQEEMRLRPPNAALLRRLAEQTGGALVISPEEILHRHGATAIMYRDAAPYVLPFAMLLILAAVLVRRHLSAR